MPDFEDMDLNNIKLLPKELGGERKECETNYR